MKRLLVVRHAKAEEAAMDDHSRTLTPQGRLDAADCGLRIKQAGFMPDWVLTSTATRAQQTWEVISEQWQGAMPTQQTAENLYQGRLYDVLKLLTSVDDATDNVMIVGHNPILTELINYLGEPAVLRFTPGSACLLTFACSHWAEIESVTADVVRITPETPEASS